MSPAAKQSKTLARKEHIVKVKTNIKSGRAAPAAAIEILAVRGAIASRRGQLGNPKSECRNPKQIRSPKNQ
jgi:hypothetical protein